MAGDKDHWSAKAYSTSASFVPHLTSTVFQYLDPHLEERILDLGCGDGVLTARIASQAQFVLGIDSSESMIASARATYADLGNCHFDVVDCRRLEGLSANAGDRPVFDKVFSNAALHWILRDSSTRESVFKNVYDMLKPGGLFVFEMGGQGNVPEVHTALRAVLLKRGVSAKEVTRSCPWWFPSEVRIRTSLEGAGFNVVKCEMEWRPTKLTDAQEGGLRGWVRLMGASFLEVLSTAEEREAAVEDICEMLEAIVTREEDGSMWLGYVRLRAIAQRP